MNVSEETSCENNKYRIEITQKELMQLEHSSVKGCLADGTALELLCSMTSAESRAGASNDGAFVMLNHADYRQMYRTGTCQVYGPMTSVVRQEVTLVLAKKPAPVSASKSDAW